MFLKLWGFLRCSFLFAFLLFPSYSESVEGVVAAIGKKMNLKNYEEFTLKYDNKDQWLTPAQSLTEQGLTEKVNAAALALQSLLKIGAWEIDHSTSCSSCFEINVQSNV